MGVEGDEPTGLRYMYVPPYVHMYIQQPSPRTATHPANSKSMKFSTVLLSVFALAMAVSAQQRSHPNNMPPKSPSPANTKTASPTESAESSRTVSASASATHDDHDDDHDDDHVSGSHSAGPSPTASVGCVSHGNHWDCTGPRQSATGAVSSAAAGMNSVNLGVMAVVGATGALVL